MIRLCGLWKTPNKVACEPIQNTFNTIAPVASASKRRQARKAIDVKPPVPGYLYMIREREFVRLEENTYKIGRSKNFESRFQSYPKDSEVIGFFVLRDHINAETNLIRLFDSKFVQKKEYGREYYQGDPEQMKETFLQFCLEPHKVGTSATLQT